MEEIFKKNCKIETNEKLGRYVQAKHDLAAGDCLLLEQPSLILASNGEIRCQNCFKLTHSYCKICVITPLCPECPQHYEYDCKTLSSSPSTIDSNILQKYPDTCGILKFLLIQNNDETRQHFNKILKAESHLDKRRNTKIWQYYEENVIQPILKSKILKILSLGSEVINEEFLQRLCALIDVNSFEIRAPDVGSMRGVYIKGALLSHDCMANTCIAIDDKHCMKIYANRNIKSGEIITNCYTNILLNTTQRKKVLLEGKYFHCSCKRCEDPTELGSHMSTLICDGCHKGYMIRVQDNKEKWQCLECKDKKSSTDVEQMLKMLQNEELQETESLAELEMKLEKLEKLLHPQHYLIIDVKQNIASNLRAIINNISCCPGRKVYERKMDLCRDILKVLEIIAPGISRLKAIVVYESGSTWAEYNRMRYQEKELNKKDLRELLQESELMLRNAIRMLLYEPKETPEGKLLVSIMQELKYLQTDLKMLQ